MTKPSPWRPDGFAGVQSDLDAQVGETAGDGAAHASDADNGPDSAGAPDAGRNSNSPLLTCGVPRIAHCRAGEQCFRALPTGQNKCYDVSGTAISCPGEAGEDDCSQVSLCGQDGAYPGAGRRFRAIGEGEYAAVCSEETGLVWQQEVVGLEWQAAVEHCKSLTLDGVDDWRLPEVYELLSLADYGEYPLTIDLQYFSEPSEFTTLWSATEVTQDPLQAWTVRYADGRSSMSARDVEAGVRCVRGGFEPDGSKPFGAAADGQFFDSRTHLTWQAGTTGGLQWPEALAHCEDSTANGRPDWRLPDVNEAATLVSYAAYHPASLVDGMPSNWFWTSTTMLKDGMFAYIINMKDWGQIAIVYKTPGSQAHVRCVRGPGDWVCDDVACSSPTSGLEFLKVAGEELFTQQAGKDHCAALIFGGHDDWRLPSISELREAVKGCSATGAAGGCNVSDACDNDQCQNASCNGCPKDSGPSLDSCYTDSSLSGPCYWYWSSTAVSNTDFTAWGIDFGSGLVGSVGCSTERAVRCVRGP